MKNAIILIVALAILLYASFWELNYIEETSKYVIADVDYIINAIKSENYDSANEHIKELNKTWESMKKTWSVFIAHDEIDDVQNSITDLKTYTKLENRDEAIASAEQLKQNLIHIARKQKVKLENVI